MKKLNPSSHAISATYLSTIQEATIGLLHHTKPEPVYFQTRWGIHTFGMKFPIDVLILDDEFIIRSAYENIHPNRAAFWNPRFKHVIELPSGYIQKQKIKTRDRVLLSLKKNHANTDNRHHDAKKFRNESGRKNRR